MRSLLNPLRLTAATLAILISTHLCASVVPVSGTLPDVAADLHRLEAVAGGASAFANNPGGRFSFELAPGRVLFGTGPGTGLAIRMTAIGRDDQGLGYSPGPLRIEGNMAAAGCAGDWLREEWVNGADGLKHTFILAKRLPGSGPLRCLIDSSGSEGMVVEDGTVRFVAKGRDFMTCDALRVWDAQGRMLPARFTPRRGGFAIEVDDADAVYPVTVDPLFSSSVTLDIEGSAVTLAMDEDVLLVGVPGWNVKPGSNLAATIASAGGALGGMTGPDVLNDPGSVTSLYAAMLKECLVELGWVDNTIYGVGAVFAYQNVRGKWEFRDVIQRWKQAVNFTTWSDQIHSEEHSNFGASLAIGGGSVMIGSPGFKFTQYNNLVVLGTQKWSGPHDVGAVEFYNKPSSRSYSGPFFRAARESQITLDGSSKDVWTGDGLVTYRRFGQKVAMTPSYAVVASGKGIDINRFGTLEKFSLGSSAELKDPAYGPCKLHYYRYQNGWRRDPMTFTANDTGWPIEGLGVIGDDTARDVVILTTGDEDTGWTLYKKPDPWANPASGKEFVENIRPGGIGCSLAVSGRRVVVGVPGYNQIRVYDFGGGGSWSVSTLAAPEGLSAMGRAVAVHGDFIIATAGTGGSQVIAWRRGLDGIWTNDAPEVADGGRPAMAIALNAAGEAAFTTENSGKSRLHVKQLARRFEGTVLMDGRPLAGVPVALTAIAEIPVTVRDHPWNRLWFDVTGNRLGNPYRLEVVTGGIKRPAGQDPSQPLNVSVSLTPPIQPYDHDGDGRIESGEGYPPTFHGGGAPGAVELDFEGLGYYDSLGTKGLWKLFIYPEPERVEDIRLRALCGLPPGITSPNPQVHHWGSEKVVLTDAQGRFRFDGLDGAYYQVEARGAYKGTSGSLSFHSTIQRDMAINVIGNLKVSGAVTADNPPNIGLPPYSSSPIAGVGVRVTQGSLVRETVTGPDGRYEVDELVPGPAIVTTFDHPYSFENPARNVDLQADRSTTANFRAIGNGSLTVEVGRALGGVLPDTEVTVNGPFGFSRKVLSGADGFVRLGGLLPGEYSITGSGAGLEWQREAVKVTIPSAGPEASYDVVASPVRSVGGGVAARVTVAGEGAASFKLALRRILSENERPLWLAWSNPVDEAAFRNKTEVVQEFAMTGVGVIKGAKMLLPYDEFGWQNLDHRRPPRDVVMEHPDGYRVSLGQLAAEPADGITRITGSNGSTTYVYREIDLAAFEGMPYQGTWKLRRYYDQPLLERSFPTAQLRLSVKERTYGPAVEGYSDRDGRCGFYDMPSGAYELALHPFRPLWITGSSGAEEAARWPWQSRTLQIASNQLQETGFAPRRNNVVSGWAFSGLTRIPSAAVRLRETGGSVIETTADANGDFVFPIVPSGEYHLESGEDAVVAESMPSIRAGSFDLTGRWLRLVPAGVVSGRILDGDGNPLGGERFRLVPDRKMFEMPAVSGRVTSHDRVVRFPFHFGNTRARIGQIRASYEFVKPVELVRMTGIESADGYRRRFYQMPVPTLVNGSYATMFTQSASGAYADVPAGGDSPYSFQEWGIRWQHSVDALAALSGRSLSGGWTWFGSHGSGTDQLIQTANLKLWVDSWRLPSDGETREAVTNSEGRFSFTGIGPSFFRVEHVAGGRYFCRDSAVVVDASVAGAQVSFTALQQRAAGLVTENGQAVEGLTVLLAGDSGAVYRAVTGSDGRFSIAIPARERLRIRAVDNNRWFGSDGIFVEPESDGSIPIPLTLMPRETPQFIITAATGVKGPALFQTSWFRVSGPHSGTVEFDTPDGTPLEQGTHAFSYVFRPSAASDRFRPVAGTVSLHLEERQMFPVFSGAPELWQTRFPFALANRGSLRAVSLGDGYGLGVLSGGGFFSWTFSGTPGVAAIPEGLGPVKSVAAGFNHAAALLADGTVRCWGNDNGSGCLAASGSAIAVAAGLDYTAVLRPDRSLEVFGVRASVHPGPFRSLAGGKNALLAVGMNGTVLVVGAAGDKVVANMPAGLAGVVAAAVGRDHALVQMADGTIRAWGADNEGQVSGIPASLTDGGWPVAAIAASGNGSVALGRDGRMQVWGNAPSPASPEPNDCLAVACRPGLILSLVATRRALGADLDDDGLIDEIDPDIDNDGVPNAQDTFPYDPSESADSDGDGIGDKADTDNDNDGCIDAIEIRLEFDPRSEQSKPGPTTVSGMGFNSFTDLPSDIVDFDASANVAVFLRSNGTALVRSGVWMDERLKLLETEGNLVQVAAGNQFVLGLRSNGTLVLYGSGLAFNNGIFTAGSRYSQPSGTPENVVEIRALGDVACWLKGDGTAGSLEYKQGWDFIAIHEAFAKAGSPLADAFPGSFTSGFIRPDGTAFLANASGVVPIPQDIPALRRIALGGALYSGIDQQGALHRWNLAGDIAPSGTLPPLLLIDYKGYGLVGITTDGAARFISEKSYVFGEWVDSGELAPAGFPDSSRTGYRKVQVHSDNRGVALRELRHEVGIVSAMPDMGGVSPEAIKDAVPGALLNVQASPRPGHVFTGWSGAFAGMPASFTWPVNAPVSASASFARDLTDADGDGLSAYDELVIHGSDPMLADTDGDGLRDGDEAAAGSDMRIVDTDGDGVIDSLDGRPIDHRHTSPREALQPGRLMVWGHNTQGQCSIGDQSNRRFLQVEAKGYITLALTDEGEVVGWGLNDSGQLDIPEKAKSGVVRIALDRFGSQCLALRSSGELIAWGSHAELDPGLSQGVADIAPGLALMTDGTLRPTQAWRGQVPEAARKRVIEIASDGYHFMALLTGGKVVSWGINYDRQAAVPPDALSGVRSIATSGDTAYAVTAGGRLISWGYPESLPPTVDSGVARVLSHGFAVKTDGTLVSWGGNNFGQAVIPAGVSSNVLKASRSWFHSALIVGPRTIAGTLLDDAGAPLANSTLRVVSDGREILATTDAEGSFRFSVEGGGELAFSMNHPSLRGAGGEWSVSSGNSNISGLSLKASAKLVQGPTSQPPLRVPWETVFGVPARSDADQPLVVSVHGDAVRREDGSVLSGALGGRIYLSLSAPATADHLPYQEVFEIEIGRRPQTIAFAPPARAWIGTPLALDATSSAGLATSLRVVSGPATVSSGKLVFSGPGEVVVEASQQGSGYYEPSVATATILGERLATTLRITSNDRIFGGRPTPVTVVTDPPDVPVDVYYDGQTQAPSKPGIYQVRAVVNSPLHSGEVQGALSIRLEGLNPVFAESAGGEIIRTYHANGQSDPQLLSEPDGCLKSYSYHGTTAAGVTYGPLSQPPVETGTYVVEVIAGNEIVAGSASAAFIIRPALRPIGIKPGFRGAGTGRKLDLTEVLDGIGDSPFVVEVLSGDASLERSLVAWGAQGEVGQMGFGWPATRQLDLPDVPASEVVDAALGDGYGLLLTTGGSVIEWGGHFSYESPAEVSSGVVAIAAGPQSRAAVTADGRLIHWGEPWLTDGGGRINEWGWWEYVSPEDVSSPPGWIQGHVRSVALADRYGVALLEDGSITDWGVRPEINPYADPYDPASWNQQFIVPKPADLPPVVALSSSRQHVLALDAAGCVHAWGYNHWDGCSVPEEARNGVVKVFAGLMKNYAIKADGSAVAWGPGWEEFDESLNGFRNFQTDPAGLRAKEFAISLKSVLALTPDDSVHGWGAPPLRDADIPSALSRGRTRWIRAGEDFVLAMRDTPVLLANAAGTIRIRVKTPADANHQETERIIELQAVDTTSIPVAVEILGGGGTVDGAGDHAIGDTATLRAAPQAGQVPLGWILNGKWLAPVPVLNVTVQEGTTVAIRFGAAHADDDGDGQSNLLEYALGGDPLVPSASLFRTTQLNGTIRFSFWKTADPAISYAIQAGQSPSGPWNENLWEGHGGPNEAGETTVETGVNAGSNRFYRLRVSAP